MNSLTKIVLAASVAALTLTGCGSDGQQAQGGHVQDGSTEITQINVNGKVVTCAVWDGYNAGGIDCDWANAK